MIYMRIGWFEMNDDGTVNYGATHEVTVRGAEPSECMDKFRQVSQNLDLTKNTPARILYIY